MKVLFLIDSLIGYGAEKSIVEIIIRLKKADAIVVHLFEGDQLKNRLQDHAVKVYSLNLRQKRIGSKAIKVLKSIIEIEKPQIIHTTLFSSEMAGRKLKRFYPEILLVGSFVSNSYSKIRYRQLPILSQFKLLTTQWRDKISASKVDFFISNSKAIQFSNAKVLGIDENKISIIYRGRNISSMSKNQNSNIKNEIDLENKNVFLNIARLQRSKGHMDLILAFKLFQREYKESVLLIAGEGNYRKTLEQYIKKNNLEEVIYLLGYRGDITALLDYSSVFIFPSYYEGLSGALVEAAIAKKPIIASDIPENRECLAKDAALFFPPGDINALKSQMEKSISCDNWQEKLEKSYVHVRDNFEISQISEKYDQFYKKILKNSKS